MSTLSGMPRGHREPNALHRRARRQEDMVWLLLTSLVVLAGVICLAIAVSVHAGVAERTRELASESRLAPALVVAGTPSLTPSSYGRYPVGVSWTGSDGLPRSGHTTLTERHDPGDTVEVWVNRDDRLVAAPPGPQDAVLVAVVIWLFAMLVGVSGIALLGRLLLAYTWHRIGRAWEQEWAQVEPAWRAGPRR